MRIRHVLSALIAFGTLVPGRAFAQENEPATEAPVSRAQKALADFEAVRDRPKDEARRKQALLWLGEVDDPAVTECLQRELVAAGVTNAAVTVCDAIAKAPRPSLYQDLHAVLHGANATDAVRAAAAKAIASFGERGIDKLLEIVHGPVDATTPRARDSAIGAIIATGNDRALRTFAPMLLDGPMQDRLKLLRRMDDVRGVFPIDAARIKLVSEATIDVAAVAWRQLATTGHERARSLAIDMLERLVEEPRAGVAADLIGGIVLVHDPDLYPVLLRFGGVAGDVVRKALRAAAPDAAKDRALVEFLITKGLESDKPTSREVARLLLADAPAEAFQPLLTKLRPDIRAGKKKSLELAISLHELLAKDPSWQIDLLNLASSPDAGMKVVGLSLLLELGVDTAIPVAQKSVGSRAWELRSVVYRYLGRCRDTSSIPILISRVDLEEGRLAQELGDALFSLTGTRRLHRQEWAAWWASNGAGFAMPAEQTVRTALAAGSGTSGGSTLAYHGIPLVSHRAAFVVDISGSMNEKIGTDKKRTRLDEAKDQLQRVVNGLSEDHRVNLIWFSGNVQSTWEKLRRATAGNREELIASIGKANPKPGTNIFDALEEAFKDREVDTIYLLTDGEPTVGRLVNPDEIIEEVMHWNLERQIIIHAISVGTNSMMLKRLAETSGGIYKFVR